MSKIGKYVAAIKEVEGLRKSLRFSVEGTKKYIYVDEDGDLCFTEASHLSRDEIPDLILWLRGLEGGGDDS